MKRETPMRIREWGPFSRPFHPPPATVNGKGGERHAEVLGGDGDGPHAGSRSLVRYRRQRIEREEAGQPAGTGTVGLDGRIGRYPPDRTGLDRDPGEFTQVI